LYLEFDIYVLCRGSYQLPLLGSRILQMADNIRRYDTVRFIINLFILHRRGNKINKQPDSSGGKHDICRNYTRCKHKNHAKAARNAQEPASKALSEKAGRKIIQSLPSVKASYREQV
jgi:hypothetical protein